MRRRTDCHNSASSTCVPTVLGQVSRSLRFLFSPLFMSFLRFFHPLKVVRVSVDLIRLVPVVNQVEFPLLCAVVDISGRSKYNGSSGFVLLQYITHASGTDGVVCLTYTDFNL